MDTITLLSAAEQVAAHLREALLREGSSGTIPGVRTLATDLGVNRKTVERALNQLEREGLLVAQGAGRRRRIVLPEGHGPPVLRVARLDYDIPSQGADYIIDLRHRIETAGHVPLVADKTLEDLGMDAGRVARYVKKTEADAWIVGAASQKILEWFSRQETPTFALFGRMAGLPMAGTKPDRESTLSTATRHLTGLGHQRISFLCRHQHRLPEPNQGLRIFLDELEAAGIETGSFNLPDWEESKEGFAQILDSLFGGPTPPTALILDEPILYHAAHHHLAKRGLQVPENVSLICTDADPDLAWCEPSVAHIHWDYRPVVRRVVRWVNNVAAGKEDQRQSFTKAEFVKGGTVGPVV
ncbi:MAG: substrate-binding domain-containing protein [Akkermansiaceae bacterium]